MLSSPSRSGRDACLGGGREYMYMSNLYRGYIEVGVNLYALRTHIRILMTVAGAGGGGGGRAGAGVPSGSTRRFVEACLPIHLYLSISLSIYRKIHVEEYNVQKYKPTG